MSARRATIAATLLAFSCALPFVGVSGRAGTLTVLPINFFDRASGSATGAQADAGSYRSSLSADGRFVAFLSAATNLGETAQVLHNMRGMTD